MYRFRVSTRGRAGPFLMVVDPSPQAPCMVTRPDGAPLNLPPQSEQLLLALVDHAYWKPEQVLTHDDLRERVWRQNVVTRDAIQRGVYRTRHLLWKCGARADLIETRRRRGYRLDPRAEVFLETTDG